MHDHVKFKLGKGSIERPRSARWTCGNDFSRHKETVKVRKIETFVEKVRYGSGPRFNKTLEDRGGWIA